MKVMGFEHIFEKAVQFKPKPGGNLGRFLIFTENSSNFYILSFLFSLFSVRVCLYTLLPCSPHPPPATDLVLYLNCAGKSTVVSGLNPHPWDS